jgi:hypothetical protein
MLVTIVAVANADNTGLDLDRLEKVEDLPDEVALKMLDFGSARQPSDDELAAYREQQTAEKPANKPARQPRATPAEQSDQNA